MAWVILILFLVGLIVFLSVFMGRQRRVSRRGSDDGAGTVLPATSTLCPDTASSVMISNAGEDRDERLGTAGDESCKPGSGDSGSSDSGSCDSGGDSGSSGGSE
ncbi:hypothetical protein ACFOPQ_02495 [Deinococcus antarcticus]|uniref:Uncharacterized protein n=1 Tax=Deinococcus antarcticus TaxID=1298767 RepID=A0ABV8A2W6_9DEIO